MRPMTPKLRREETPAMYRANDVGSEDVGLKTMGRKGWHGVDVLVDLELLGARHQMFKMRCADEERSV